MKKIVILLVVALGAVALLTACSGGGTDLCLHEWSESPSEQTLKSEATCTSGATYYKICTKCSKLGETFVSGDAVEHVWGNTSTDEYLLTAATCSERAVYYRSCKNCGVKGNETYSHGATLPHTWDAIANDETFFELPTCVGGATYKYTCAECGTLSGADKLFVLGPSVPHFDSHGDDICDTCKKPMKHWDDVSVDIVTDIHIFGKKED